MSDEADVHDELQLLEDGDIILWLPVVIALLSVAQFNFSLFFALSEGTSIIVACGLFMLAWNARRFVDNGFLVFLGIMYFGVAILDVCHLLSSICRPASRRRFGSWRDFSSVPCLHWGRPSCIGGVGSSIAMCLSR